MKTEVKIALVATILGIILGMNMTGESKPKEVSPEVYVNDTICETRFINERIIFEK